MFPGRLPRAENLREAFWQNKLGSLSGPRLRMRRHSHQKRKSKREFARDDHRT